MNAPESVARSREPRTCVTYASVALVQVTKPSGDVVPLSWRVLRAAASQDDAVLRAIYGDLLREAERMLLSSMRDATNRRVASCPNHAALRSREAAFFGPVARDPNPAAHGGVCIHETCSCGAERSTNVNGRHIEEGAWAAPDIDLEDVRSLAEGGA